jgi:hypothetical protein
MTGNRSNSGYDAVAAQYRSNLRDPYADVAARAREMGARFPGAYEAVAADAIQAGVAWSQPARPQPLARMPDLSGDNIFDAANLAGQRTSMFGSHGLDADVYGANTMDARQWANFEATGSRNPQVPNADLQEDAGRRVSGRLANLETMSQRVPKGRPWLTLRTTASAHCRVTAQMSGGFEQSREFWIGGGSTASFLLGDYESATVEVLGASPTTTQVQFAWIGEGMQAGNQELYLPQAITPSAPLFVAVPEGAFAVSAGQPDAFWTWDQPGVVGYSGTVGIASVSSGVAARNPVLGSRFMSGVVNQIMWILRPI